MIKISIKHSLIAPLLIALSVFLRTEVVMANDVPAKNYFGKYVSADSNGGIVESVERVDLANRDMSNLNPQHIYTDDRGVPLAFFNEKGQTISKEGMLQGSRQRMEREQRMCGSGTFFKDGYARDSDYYGRLTGHNPSTNTPSNANIHQGQNITQSFSGAQSQDTFEVSGAGAVEHIGGTGLLPTPKTLNGETVGLSGIAPIDPSKLSVDSIPDGFVLLNGVLVKDPAIQENAVLPKEEWPTERMEKSLKNNAEGLENFREKVKAEGREPTSDELRLAACRLDIQNRVYVNPNIKLTPGEIEKEATKQAEEWKRDNRYMMSDGQVASYGPDGVEGWIKNERERVEKFIQETGASVRKYSNERALGLTQEEKATEEKAIEATLKNQAEFEKSMREDSEKKIAKILKDTGVKDPGFSRGTVPKVADAPKLKTLVSYEQRNKNK